MNVNELNLLIGSIGESNKGIVDRISGLVAHIKEDVNKITMEAPVIAATPTLSTTSTPTTISPIPRSPVVLSQQTETPTTSSQKISFSDSVFTNNFLHSISDSDLRGHNAPLRILILRHRCHISNKEMIRGMKLLK